jgi:Tol biopolymer transport system component
VINLVLTTENSPGGLFVNRFSPNHNYLVLQTNVGFSSSSSQRQQDIYLHDIQSQTSQSYTLARDTILPERSWSNNGEWLAILEDGYFILSAPKANYDHLVPYDFRDCTSLAWIK